MTKKFIWAWIILFLILCVALFAASASSNKNFIKGKYGGKCYVVGSEHGNIRYPIYFESLEECLKFLPATTEQL